MGVLLLRLDSKAERLVLVGYELSIKEKASEYL